MLTNKVRSRQPSLEDRISLLRHEPFAYSLEEVVALLQAWDLHQSVRRPTRASLQRSIISDFSLDLSGQRYKNLIKGFTSPIRRLPTELLLIIFDYACDRNLLRCVDSKRLSSSLSCLPVLSIGSTCIQWCGLAVLTPTLWTRITVKIAFKEAWGSFGRVVERRVKNLKLLLQLFLGRSKNSPLIVNLIVTGKNYWVPAPAIQLLLQHCQRWETFRYEGDSPVSDHINDGDLHLDILRDIYINTQSYWSSSIKVFTHAPNLTSMTGPSIAELSISRSITTLDVCFNRQFLQSLLTIADNCPKLTNLVLRELPGNPFDSPNRPCHRRTLDHLHTFRICLHERGYSYTEMLNCILEVFSIPSLTELEIIPALPGHGYSCVWPSKLFCSFLDISSCQITKLVLQGVRISTEDLIPALHSLPSIIYLHISDQLLAADHSPITGKFIRNLEWPRNHDSSHPPLVPKLCLLRLEFCGNSFDNAAFSNTVISRRMPDERQVEGLRVECLQTVILCFFARQVDDNVYEPLRPMQRKGMTLAVTGMTKVPERERERERRG
ncbi:hypothetical protein BT96DRAFT_995198 [Gymnopus androsaceus JB14]|uniref:Uncharacterized protein n=1 Tax=Gymnopus androsaceus JB14 TaxID=1447944 RepID=A0A6A4HLU8_9AGAR|nr:hypothetical protein BT96DRAFT_995198 [Gymnopus androsaceus JB14]